MILYSFEFFEQTGFARHNLFAGFCYANYSTPNASNIISCEFTHTTDEDTSCLIYI